jgi:uncharacterized protein
MAQGFATESVTTDPELSTKLEHLGERLRQLGSVIVCYSGGLDSGFLLAVAHQQLGDKACGLTATGPALAPSELKEASAFAEQIGARLELVDALEMQQPGYQANGPDRCFHCKAALYASARTLQESEGFRHIANGTNLDDLGDYRPGLDAAKAAGIESPLLECGFTKADIRAAAQRLGLPIWDKPAAACLASRIPYGTAVTAQRLAQVAGFEAELRQLGFRGARVRHHESIARIEVQVGQLPLVVESPTREKLLEAGKRNGFVYVTVDIAGYRTGSHNEMLTKVRLPVMG